MFQSIDNYDQAISSIDFTPVDQAKLWNPTMIKFNGKIVMMDSGKYIWRKKGDAKLALRRTIMNQIQRKRSSSVSYTKASEWAGQIMEQLIDMKVIELVEGTNNVN